MFKEKQNENKKTSEKNENRKFQRGFMIKMPDFEGNLSINTEKFQC